MAVSTDKKYLLFFSLAFLLSLQCIILLGLILSFHPLPMHIELLNPNGSYYLHPKYDLSLYALFLALCGGFYLLLCLYGQPNGAWIRVEFFWVLLQIFAILKMANDGSKDGPFLYFLYTALCLSFASKLYWEKRTWIDIILKPVCKTVSAIANLIYKKICILTNYFPIHLRSLPVISLKDSRIKWLLSGGMLIFIAMLIYIPDLETLVGKLFFVDDQSQENTFMAGAAFGVFSGLTPCVDIRSLYGVGLPLFWGKLMGLLGHFDYLTLTHLFVDMFILYYCAWFLLIRSWVKSSILGFTLIVLIINLNIFGMDGGPITLFTHINTTAVRFGLDILFFVWVTLHLQTRRSVFLLLTGITAGLQLFYVLPTGICLTVTFYGYIIILLTIPALCKYFLSSRWDYALTKLACILVPVLFFSLMAMSVGPNILTQSFWYNFLEQVRYATNDFPMFPYFSLWQDSPFLLFTSWAILIIFMASFFLVLTSIRRKGVWNLRLMIIVLLSLYGILDYQQFLMLADPSVLLRNEKIIVLVIGLWIDIFLEKKTAVWRFYPALGALTIVFFSMVINPHFRTYPNIFNVSKNPNIDPRFPSIMNKDAIHFPEWYKLPVNSLGEKFEDFRTESDFKTDQDLKEYIRKEFNFDKDSQLIRALTPEGSRVAVISSNEMLFLIQSRRKPFFYIFPLICSRPMRIRTFPDDQIFTKENLLKTMYQLENQAPKYIFVQKILLNRNIPSGYFFDYQGISNLMHYVLDRYEPYQDGYYLMAMKRR